MKRRADVIRSDRSHVALLTRLPIAGRVKTRLAAALGPEGAAEVHRALTEHVALEVKALGATGEARVAIWHDQGTARRMRRWLGALPHYYPQPEGDLGERLRAVMERAFSAGAKRCLAVGSDCPAMTAEHLRLALAALERADLVLGPAADGGYWLIGLRAGSAARALPVLFEGISWGSAEVLRETIARAKAMALNLELLEELSDIDRPGDLPDWQRRRDVPASAMRVSVVIPTVDEAGQIGPTVARALQSSAEVVVADGGSLDGTREVAARAGAVVTRTFRGRAHQLNAGATLATGEALLFLHADTLLPARAAEHVRAALGVAGTVAGAFAYRASAGGALGLVLTTGARLRCQLSGHPYGDQGLFLRRRTFRALGGFPELPIMEDWELVARLRRLGRVVHLPEEAVTSSASFVDHGLLRAGAINVAVIVGYQLGVDAARLAAWRSRIARRR